MDQDLDMQDSSALQDTSILSQASMLAKKYKRRRQPTTTEPATIANKTNVPTASGHLTISLVELNLPRDGADPSEARRRHDLMQPATIKPGKTGGMANAPFSSEYSANEAAKLVAEQPRQATGVEVKDATPTAEHPRAGARVVLDKDALLVLDAGPREEGSGVEPQPANPRLL